MNDHPRSFDVLRTIGDPVLDPMAEDALARRPAATMAEAFVPPRDAAAALAELVRLPDWLSAADVVTANRFFARHAGLLSFLLGTCSLLDCFAAPRGVAVLAATGGLSQGNAARRLGESGRFVLAVHGEHGLAGERRAVAWIAAVRWKHAVIRARLRAGRWNQAELGAPICQEDQLGTLLAFGHTPIVRMRRLGLRVPDEAAAAVLSTWSAVGQMLGVVTERLPLDAARASALLRTIGARQHGASPAGRKLASDLLETYTAMLPVAPARELFLSTVLRATGPETCALLGLPSPDHEAGERAERWLRRVAELEAGLGIFGNEHKLTLLAAGARLLAVRPAAPRAQAVAS